jgi:hypothetical protein
MSNNMKRALRLMILTMALCSVQLANAQATEQVRPVSLRFGYQSGYISQHGLSLGYNLCLHKPGKSPVKETFMSRRYFADFSATVYTGLPGNFEMLVAGEIASRLRIHEGCFLQITAGPYYGYSVQNAGGFKIDLRERTVLQDLKYSHSVGLTGSLGLGREFTLPHKLSFTAYATLHFRQPLAGTGKKPENVFEIGFFKRIN